MNTPRVDYVTASFYRRGKCACGKTAERTVEFTGLSLADCQRQADRWQSRPLRHKKCEWMPAACDTCGDTGLVDWEPGAIRNSDADQQPCPDCEAALLALADEK